MKSAMFYFFILVVLFNCSVVCEVCETFNFENGLEDFINEGDTCDGLDMWNFGKYSDLSMDGFDSESSVFATPLTSLSCMSSPRFQMQAGGILEINLYLKPNIKMYQLVIMVLKYEEGNIDANVLTENVILMEGWQSIKIPVSGFDTYLGYVAFMAIADHQQSLLLDSLRYFTPSFEEQCLIYTENEDTTTTTVTLTTPTQTESSAFTSTTDIQTFTSKEIPTPTATETETPISTSAETSTYSEISTPTTESASTTPDSLNPTSSDAYTSTELTSVTEYYTSTISSEGTDTQDTTFIETTTESFKTSTDSETTDDPSQEGKTSFSFWNAFTITMVTVLSLIIVFVIAFTSYRIGKSRIESNISPVILSESDELPSSITVPRVTGVYSNPSRSNIFSV